MKIKSKIWLKKFSEGEFKDLVSVFKKVSPYSEDEWGKVKFSKMVRTHGHFPHMESDVSDDSLGIMPEQLKKVAKANSFSLLIDSLEVILPMFKKMLEENLLSSYLDAGYINWESVWNVYIDPETLTSKDAAAQSIGYLYIFLLSQENGWSFGLIEEDLLQAVGYGKITKVDFLQAIAGNLISVKQEVLELSNFNEEAMIAEAKLEWGKLGGYIPRCKFMLRANPRNFCREAVSALADMYGTTNFDKLPEQEARHASLLLDNFGINLEVLKISPTDPEIRNLNFGNDRIKDRRSFFRKFSQVSSSLSELKNMLLVLDKYPILEKYIAKKDKIEKSEEKFLKRLSTIILGASQEMVDGLQDLSPEFIKLIFRSDYEGNLTGLDVLLALSRLYVENKNNKSNIPVVKGSSGKYTYEILEKSDPTGLILGYATDCCQVIGGAGESCLIAGYKEPDASFFVVKKDKKIFAQSFIWQKVNSLGKKVFCFDSIEILGKNTGCSDDIVSCYKDAAKQLMDQYDVIFASADGSELPTSIYKLGREEYFDTTSDDDYLGIHGLYCPFPSVYSDVDATEKGLIIIKD